MSCSQRTQWTVTDKNRGYSQDSEQSIILQGWQVTVVAAVTTTTNPIVAQAEQGQREEPNMQWWKNQKDVVKDLLSEDRNEVAEEDAKIMSSFMFLRVVTLYLETGETEREKICGGKENHFWALVQSCQELGFPPLP